MIVYLHGFASSPHSAKAAMLAQWFADHGKGAAFAYPPLPNSPAEVMRLFVDQLHLQPGDVVIGSSLGGFYASVLAERFGCKAAVLNPVVHASRDLGQHVVAHKGQFTNHHTQTKFAFGESEIDALRALEFAAISFPERYLLVAAKGDEVLNWQDMVKFYSGAKQIVLEHSDHGLSDFDAIIDQVGAFCLG